MTAKIKLNAASGGGSIAINAPSSAGSDTDFLDTSGNLAVSGTTTCTGNLKVGTITDTSGNNSSTTAQIAQGRAKMWVNFDGTGTVAIRDSFNVSSVSDNGTGDYAVNIDTDMSNSNYCVVTAGNTGGGAGSKSVYVNSTDTDHTDIMSYDNGGNQQDRARICVAAFGDT